MLRGELKIWLAATLIVAVCFTYATVATDSEENHRQLVAYMHSSDLHLHTPAVGAEQLEHQRRQLVIYYLFHPTPDLQTTAPTLPKPNQEFPPAS